MFCHNRPKKSLKVQKQYKQRVMRAVFALRDGVDLVSGVLVEQREGTLSSQAFYQRDTSPETKASRERNYSQQLQMALPYSRELYAEPNPGSRGKCGNEISADSPECLTWAAWRLYGPFAASTPAPTTTIVWQSSGNGSGGGGGGGSINCYAF